MQGCYVFNPTTPEDEEIDPRPSKKRKLNKASQPKSVECHHDAWPRLLGGQESEDAVVLRKKLFESTWKKQQTKLDRIAHPFDEQLVQDIMEWRRHKTTEHNSFGHNQLRTCVLVSPPGTQSQFHKLWDGELCSSDDQTEIVLHLQPSQCPNLQTSLKNVIKSAITGHKGVDGYSDVLIKHKALVPMNFDLELLQRYVKLHDIDRVLISIMEVETFDTAILSELISTFHSWSNRIPFVLFIGISTTVELFETRLSRATVSLLDATVFTTSGGGENWLFNIYDTLRLDGEGDTAHVFLGPPIVDTLAELAEDQSTTTETIIRAIKYVYMSHFFANPLSILLLPTDDEDSPPWNKAFAQAIRNLPSFKSHCEALAKGVKSQKERARRLLTSDEALQSEVKEIIHSGRQVMRSSLDAIFTLRYVYHKVLELDRYSPWESEVQLLSSLPDLIDTEIFDAIVEATNAPLSTAISEESTMQILNESSKPGLNTFKIFCASKSQELDADADEDDILTLLRSYLQDLRTKVSSAQPFPTSTTTNPFRHFLAEIYSMTSKSPISQILHPRSRYSLERALTRPADYLGCPCCSITPQASNSSTVLAELDKSTFPPTSLLLSMLNEAGAIINVRDLWDAFRDTLTSNERDGDSGAADDEDGNAEERHILALFYRALAELRYLGLVKTSKRRPAPGVECVQKTAWMGL